LGAPAHIDDYVAEVPASPPSGAPPAEGRPADQVTQP
jgi:hypothetical protein